MMKKPVSRRVIAIVTAVFTMTVLCGMPAFAFASVNGVTKEETVYVVTDNTGTQQEVIVSDHLINKNKLDTIADETTLTDIENVKGEETFEQKGDSLVWNAGGNGIYYQGQTTDAVPVSMDIVYRLDNKVVTGPELQGKSGKVEIKINYNNDAEYKGSTVPFLAITGMIITDNSFRNVKVTKGKVIDDGDKLLVVGMAAPGLSQALDIGESELGIGSSVTITGDAKKFAVEDMMTVVTNSFFEDIDTDELGNLNYDAEISQLNKGARQLMEGSQKLSTGTKKMYNAVTGKNGETGLTEGLSQLASFLEELSPSLQNLGKAVKQIYKASKYLTEQLETIQKGLASGAEELDTSADKLSSGADKIGGGIQSIHDNSAAAASDLADVTAVIDDNQAALVMALMTKGYSRQEAIDLITKVYKAQKINEAIAEKTSSDSDMGKAASALKSGADALKTSAKKLKAAADGLGSYDPKAEEQTTIIGGYTEINKGLRKMNKKINESTSKGDIGQLDKLAKGSKQLGVGLKQINKGSATLAQGMTKLYNSGIKKIVDMYNNELKGTIDNLDDLMDAGKGYKTFTKLPSDMDGDVKFIYKTDMTQ